MEGVAGGGGGRICERMRF
uniref:Uncharacterized protein n=1 Tax=Arundo donax TaxID=35708 RepID=A0A0A9EIA5_ARUDO